MVGLYLNPEEAPTGPRFALLIYTLGRLRMRPLVSQWLMVRRVKLRNKFYRETALSRLLTMRFG